MGSEWHGVYCAWVDAGCPTDIPAPELALIRLQAATERDGWREKERATHAAELRAAGEKLVHMLEAIGCRLYLGPDGRPRIGGERELWRPYEPELRALREPIATILASR